MPPDLDRNSNIPYIGFSAWVSNLPALNIITNTNKNKKFNTRKYKKFMSFYFLTSNFCFATWFGRKYFTLCYLGNSIQYEYDNTLIAVRGY